MVQLLKDGAVTQEYAYDAYGYINADEFGIQAPFYGYNGEEQNPFTGLQYLRARYYAPQNGGFITQDSFSGVLTNALSQNRYAYAHNNPVNYADPSGHFIIALPFLAKAAIAAVAAVVTVVTTYTVATSIVSKTNSKGGFSSNIVTSPPKSPLISRPTTPPSPLPYIWQNPFSVPQAGGNTTLHPNTSPRSLSGFRETLPYYDGPSGTITTLPPCYQEQARNSLYLIRPGCSDYSYIDKQDEVHKIDYSFKNGVYQGADYHTGQTTGRKSAAPQDGQFALDNSVPIGSNTSRRVSIDKDGNFVVLDQTSEGVYHGHVRSWNGSDDLKGLTQEMKNALYDAGYIKSPTGTKPKLTDLAKNLITGG